MDRMIGNMKFEKKEEIMEKMMEKFFVDMTNEEKQKLMDGFMPKMMEGIDASAMMTRMMPVMMQQMFGVNSINSHEIIDRKTPNSTIPKMMKKCFSSMDKVERKKMMILCRKMMEDIEEDTI